MTMTMSSSRWAPGPLSLSTVSASILATMLAVGCAPLEEVPVGVTAQASALCGGGGAPLSYRGGKVLSSAKVALVWWGASGYNGITRATLPSFYNDILQSDWIDQLNEYSTSTQYISRGSYLGDYTIPGSAGSSTSEVQYQLSQALSQGLLPWPDDNTVFVVVFPLSYESALCTSCGGCGQRGSFSYGGHQIRFATVADHAAGIDAVTVDGSAMLAELVVDPDFQGWENSSGYSIDAICNRSINSFQTFDLYRMYKVSTLYSNDASQCVSAPIKPYCIGAGCTNIGVDLRLNNPVSISLSTNYNYDSISFQTNALPSGVTGHFNVNPVGYHGGTTFTLTADAYAHASDADLIFFAFNPSGGYIGQSRARLTVESLQVLTPAQTIPMGGSASFVVQNNTLSTRTLAAGAAGDGFTYQFSTNPVSSWGSTTLTVTDTTATPAGRAFKVYSTDNYTYTFGGITVTCGAGTTWCDSAQQCFTSSQTCPGSGGGGGGGGGCPSGKIDCCGDGACISPVACRKIICQ